MLQRAEKVPKLINACRVRVQHLLKRPSRKNVTKHPLLRPSSSKPTQASKAQFKTKGQESSFINGNSPLLRRAWLSG